jgi:hypothetical protein
MTRPIRPPLLPVPLTIMQNNTENNGSLYPLYFDKNQDWNTTFKTIKAYGCNKTNGEQLEHERQTSLF